MVQMKEQIRSPEKELSNEEIANLSDAEFKTLVIKIQTWLSMDKNRGKSESYAK